MSDPVITPSGRLSLQAGDPIAPTETPMTYRPIGASAANATALALVAQPAVEKGKAGPRYIYSRIRFQVETTQENS